MPKYLVKRSKRKTIAIEIHPNGDIWVRAPNRISNRIIEAFVNQKSAWIDQKLMEIQNRKLTASVPAHQFVTGETFLFLGKYVPLEIVPLQRPDLIFANGVLADEALADRALANGFLLASRAQPHARECFTRWYLQQARAIFSQRIEAYTQENNLRPARLRISSARTRWGSCSSNGTISLVWRLVMAPMEVVDYVVVHELSHLNVHNHSRDFWQAVAAILPDYALRRKWLRENGQSLDLI
jgi:predicted metal-dependent hydrolase